MKKVEINLGKGNLKAGFSSVIIQVFDEDNRRTHQVSDISLAEGVHLANTYKSWEFLYQIFADSTNNSHTRSYRRFISRGIEIDDTGVTNVSESSFDDICKELKQQLNLWLSPIENQLPLYIHPQSQVDIIFVTDDDETKRLPLNQWQLLDRYPDAECAVSGGRFWQKPQSRTPKGKVYILAVLGDSENINLEEDRKALQALPDSYIEWLVKPNREQLNERLWDKRGWDILFFAGHSQTLPEEAVIKLNATDYLNLEKLEYALNTAIDNGLQLAIFNSCDGSGLAKSLQKLNIPQAIVMNQPIPDSVAQEFVKKFLSEFAEPELKSSMYLTERKARERLQGMEQNYPCASWLPVIYQNPSITPLNWEQLAQSISARTKDSSPPKSLSRSVCAIAATIATVSTIALRSFGLLQGLELQAYDRLMKMRPDEGVDPNIAVVAITEKDLEEYGGYPLPDETLAEAIASVQSLQPEFIALDIFRDRPQPPGNAELRKILQNEQNIIAVCSLAGFNNPDRPGIAPPPNIENYRIGFSEMAIDSDNVVRRHLLSSQPGTTDVCQADMSLSSKLAFYYLDRQNIQPEMVDEDLQLGDVRIKNLSSQTKDNYGFQTMLNYRGGDRPFARISLQELFAGDIKSKAIEGKIVLIGMDAPISTPDNHDTPLGKLPGVVIHAHMTSQIINAVLAKRPLIAALSPWQENILIAIMSILGGYIIYRWHNLKAGIVILLVIPLTCGIGYIFLIQGFWLPMVYSTLSLILTPLLARLYCSKIWQNKHNLASKQY